MGSAPQRVGLTAFIGACMPGSPSSAVLVTGAVRGQLRFTLVRG